MRKSGNAAEPTNHLRAPRSFMLQAVLALASFVLAGAAPVSAMPVEYDYTGNAFTSVSCSGVFGSCTSLLSTDNNLTGDIVVDGALPASSVITSPALISWSFSDGVHTITNLTPGANLYSSLFVTNQFGQITNFDVGALAVLTPPLSDGTFELAMSSSSQVGDSTSYDRNPPLTGFELSFASTDMAGTWSSPCSADLLHAVHPRLGSLVSSSHEPVEIFASFSPATGVSLDQAATDCHVSNFDWQQTITYLPTPSPFFLASDPCVIAHPFIYSVVCTGISTPSGAYPDGILDPPVGGYASDLHCSDGSISAAYRYANPFYYAPFGPASDCQSLDARHNSTELTFFDSPMDVCLEGGFLLPVCGLKNALGSLQFTTRLVGVDDSGMLVDLPVMSRDDQFIWTDTYDGCALPFGLSCVGGISILADAMAADDPVSGTGGITLVEVNGVIIPGANSVPEPSTLWLAFIGIFSMIKRKSHSAYVYFAYSLKMCRNAD